jgi:hypothetical protein
LSFDSTFLGHAWKTTGGALASDEFQRRAISVAMTSWGYSERGKGWPVPFNNSGARGLSTWQVVAERRLIIQHQQTPLI